MMMSMLIVDVGVDVDADFGHHVSHHVHLHVGHRVGHQIGAFCLFLVWCLVQVGLLKTLLRK